MKDKNKTKDQLIKELAAMGQRVIELEKAEAKRKQSEEALHDIEEMFRLFMNHSPIYVFFKDENIRATQLSENFEKMLGRPVHELIGKTMEDLFPSELAKSMVQDDLRTLREGKPIEVIEQLNGRYYVTTKFPIKREGKPPLLAGFTMDITERKQAEEALRESESKFRALAESSAAAIFVIQGDKYLYINPAFTTMTGYTSEDLVSMNFWDFISPDMRELVKARGIGRQRKEDVPPRYDLKFITKSGEERFGHFGATLIEFQNKPAILGSVFDITERKKMEEALRESEEKFRLSFENANTGMCLVDMSGNLMRVNDKMCTMFGYSKQELESITVNSIAVPEDANLSPEFINKASTGEMDRAVFEKRYYHKDGHVVWGLVSSSLVHDANGKPSYFISQVQDITERKQGRGGAARREEEVSNRLARENATFGMVKIEQDHQFYPDTLNPEFYALFSDKA